MRMSAGSRRKRALPLGGVAGADADYRLVEGDAAPACHVGDAGQGRAKIALHVNGQGFEGGDVNDAAAGSRSFGPAASGQ